MFSFNIAAIAFKSLILNNGYTVAVLSPYFMVSSQLKGKKNLIEVANSDLILKNYNINYIIT